MWVDVNVRGVHRVRGLTIHVLPMADDCEKNVRIRGKKTPRMALP